MTAQQDYDRIDREYTDLEACDYCEQTLTHGECLNPRCKPCPKCGNMGEVWDETEKSYVPCERCE